MATSNTTPIVIPQPIAAQATSENINVIPNGATGTNRASFQEGFPEITRMPVIENPLPTQKSGLPPTQQDFNGLFNAVSQHNFFAQNGGLYSFNQAVSDAIGGYPQGALLWAIVGGKPTAVYSLVENNTFNFLTNPAYIDDVHWTQINKDYQHISNMEQSVSTSTTKYPSSNAVTNFANAAGNPVGTIITWASNNAPDGYLICNGAAISRTTYARLFNVIGTTWGAGDGNTTFNLPTPQQQNEVVETYHSGTEWYRVWSDGWIEQGGRIQIQASTYADITLLKPFADKNYMISFSHSLLGTSGQAESYAIPASASSIRLGNGCGNAQSFTWSACGYGNAPQAKKQYCIRY